MTEHTPSRFSEQDPWDVWGLTPYTPDPRPSVLVNDDLTTGDFVAPVPKPKLAVVGYTAYTGRTMCTARMHYHEQRRRGRFGVRSPLTASKPCSRRAVVEVLYSDGSTAPLCKEHAPV